METVSDILKHKGNQVWTIDPDAYVFDGVQSMSDLRIGALVVVAQPDQLVGILSERDYARKIVLRGRSSKSTRVREIMTENVVTASPSWELNQCMREMTHGRFRHLPILDQGRLTGLVSIGDVVFAIISEQRFVIDQLSHYMQIN